MGRDKTLNKVSQIFDLLHQEKQALIDGDIEALQVLTAQKQGWIDGLENKTLPLTYDQIRKIKSLSDQNAALSASCQLAQKSVMDRLAEIRKIQKTMGIYGVDGTFVDAQTAPPKVESKF